VSCPQIIPRVLHDAQHELGAHARIVPATRARTRVHGSPPRRVQQLFRSFREASISSATRRESPRLVSYATIDLAGFDAVPQDAASKQPAHRRRVKGGLSKIKRERERERERKESHDKEERQERRRETVARVATSIRFSSLLAR